MAVTQMAKEKIRNGPHVSSSFVTSARYGATGVVQGKCDPAMLFPFLGAKQSSRLVDVTSGLDPNMPFGGCPTISHLGLILAE